MIGYEEKGLLEKKVFQEKETDYTQQKVENACVWLTAQYYITRMRQ